MRDKRRSPFVRGRSTTALLLRHLAVPTLEGKDKVSWLVFAKSRGRMYVVRQYECLSDCWDR